jgi:immunity protein 5 of polymorphic toxin system
MLALAPAALTRVHEDEPELLGVSIEDRPPGFARLRLGACLVAHRPGVERMQVIQAPTMILPKVRDARFVTIRRGGTLTDSDHQLLALWAATCAEHVLGLFALAEPEDRRPREAIEQARAWVRGEVKMTEARRAAGHAMAAARDLRGAPRYAAYAAGQAGVAAHELGAVAYAIKAARAGAPEGESDRAGRLECRWQRDQLPEAIRELVLDDQRLRNDICWSVFDC